MSCGVPYKLWSAPGIGAVIRQAFGSGSSETLPGRNGKNADLPYWLNAFTAANGSEVVQANCLWCHGGKFDGELIVGLGNATADFTAGLGGGVATGNSDSGSVGCARPYRRRKSQHGQSFEADAQRGTGASDAHRR
jgi:hypothetical protein